jgi:hypothetical protein
MVFYYFYYFQAERMFVENTDMTNRVNDAILIVHTAHEIKFGTYMEKSISTSKTVTSSMIARNPNLPDKIN